MDIKETMHEMYVGDIGFFGTENLIQMQWQPIETAPKDGTSILIFTTGKFWRDGWSDEDGWRHKNEKPHVLEAFWSKKWYNHDIGGWMPANCDEEYGQLYEATHWMPMPEPPK